ncbi:MAG TPA: GspE/PulE family protein [Pirellulaceae bacterium]|nr:GspE/PulE family protein [Pirellulaceae bacterium]
MSQAPTGRFRITDLVKMEAGEAVNALLEQAAQLRASDLFLLSDERFVTASIRRMGSIEKLAVVSTEHGRQMMTHLKALAGMDISDRRRAADGRLIHDVGGRKLDLRINSTPMLHGEDMALRLWDHSMGLFGIDELGMSRADLNKLLFMLNHPSGLLLVTGPTGTGKTTSLYACLQYLNDGARKINTLEDPIEYAIDGIRQSQVNSKFGLDFPELLRNVLRQAPDVIMIGEIRDEETAMTAVRAANSGHLVLATLHAPTAASAIHSMLALGSHPFFLSGCLLGVIAQRLVRTLCPNCRSEYDISFSPQTFQEIESLLSEGEGKAIYGPSGCEECFHLGYVGRSGLFEVMTINQELRRLVSQAAPSQTIEEAAIRAGMTVFRRGALLKVAQGITSTEEILRDVPAEHLGLED